MIFHRPGFRCDLGTTHNGPCAGYLRCSLCGSIVALTHPIVHQCQKTPHE